MAMVNNDRNLYIKVLENVHSKYDNFVEQIEKEISRGQYDTTCRLVHTLKGVSGTMGAKELQKISSELETALKTRQTNLLSDHIATLTLELNRVMNALDGFFEMKKELSDETKNSRPKGSVCDMNTIHQNSRLTELFSVLGQLIDQGNSKALTVVDELKTLLGPERIDDHFLQLEEQIDNYEFDDARESLDRFVIKIESQNLS